MKKALLVTLVLSSLVLSSCGTKHTEEPTPVVTDTTSVLDTLPVLDTTSVDTTK
jgi:hypothetical protein